MLTEIEAPGFGSMQSWYKSSIRSTGPAALVQRELNNRWLRSSQPSYPARTKTQSRPDFGHHLTLEESVGGPLGLGAP